MRQNRQGPDPALLKLRTVCWVAVASVVLGTVFLTHFLIEGLSNDGGRVAVATAGALFAVTAAQTVVTLALAQLRPPAWYVGMGTFGVGAILSLYLVVVEPRRISAVYLLANATVAAGVYVLRPLFTPGAEARRRIDTAGSVLDEFAIVGPLRRADPSRELMVYAGFVLTTATVSFYKGVWLFWQPDGVSTYVGLVYVVFALLQFRACYGLLLQRRRGWFLSLLLCSIVTAVALYHIVVAEDTLSVVIFLLDISNVTYLYRRREKYVPGLTVDLTPR